MPVAACTFSVSKRLQETVASLANKESKQQKQGIMTGTAAVNAFVMLTKLSLLWEKSALMELSDDIRT